MLKPFAPSHMRRSGGSSGSALGFRFDRAAHTRLEIEVGRGGTRRTNRETQ